MSGTNPVGGTNASLWVSGTDNSSPSPRASGDGTIPPADDGTDIIQIILTLPTLPAPKVGGLSLEMLVQAVGMEERATATKAGTESIKAKAQERDEINAKKMEEIQKNLDDMKSKGVLDGFLKAFKIIGMILGAIASVATIALGVATGNPLLIAAGAIMATMTVNSIISEASGGKASIAAGIGAIAKACGASDEVAQWIGFGVEIGITLVGCALSLGAGSAAGVSKAVEAGMKAGDIAAKVTRATTIASGLTTVAQGATQGVSAYYDYRTSMSQADQKELAAILERIQEAISMEQDFMEAIMQRSNELMGDVGEIVQENAAAQTAVLTGSAPSMA